MKDEVDEFIPGRGIPCCQLLARTVDQTTTEPLLYTITLNGAKSPNNTFTIYHAKPATGIYWCINTAKFNFKWFENSLYKHFNIHFQNIPVYCYLVLMNVIILASTSSCCCTLINGGTLEKLWDS